MKERRSNEASRSRIAAPAPSPEPPSPVETSGVPSCDIIRFPEGLPGFEACHGFVLLAASDGVPVQRLESVEGPEARFLTIDPRCVLPTYRFELSESDRARLDAKPDTPLLWLAMVMLEADGTITVNLRAPVVINPEQMIGRQVMPYECLYPLRHVLAPAA
jgi:flagellar assembly factor FliW